MPEKEKKRNPKTTLAICLACMVLGVPVAGVAINLESTFMAEVSLKNPDSVINGPHIALFGAAAMSIIASTVVMLGSMTLRHLSPKNVPVGLLTFGMACLNVVAQLIILSLIYITNSVHPVATARNDVRFVDGQYDTGGKQFTRETWSCTLENFHLDREPWSRNACSEYVSISLRSTQDARLLTEKQQHYARYCTILLVNTAALLLSIAYWPVRNYLFGRSKNAAAAPGKA